MRDDQGTSGQGLGECPQGVPTALWERLRELLANEQAPLAVFDADGTLWADDLGETHLRVLDQGHALSPQAPYGSLLEEYEVRCRRDVDDGYAWGAQVLASMPEDEIWESCREAWRRHRPRLLAPVVAVLQGLQRAGVDVAVVSASNQWLIEVAVADFDVSPERVVAVSLERTEGQLTDRVVQPMPNGEGKVGAIKVQLGRQPTLAFGNSRHDIPMMAYASLGVFVLATTPEEPELAEALEERRADSDWLYLPVPHPLASP